MFVFLLLMVLPSLSLVEALLAHLRFMFPLFLMFLDLPCRSFLVARLLTLVVGSFSTMIHVLFRIVALASCLVLALDALMVFGILTGFVAPPATTTSLAVPVVAASIISFQ